jgi:endonuclease/exonuclease/phosphatase family metal-dependent hydrolase
MSVDKTPTRIDACVEMLKHQNADIIGLQETMYNSTWNKVYNELKEEGYDGFSVIRMNNPKFEEGTSILYNTNKFILTFQHNFWLSIPSTPPYPTLEEEKEKEPNRTWFGAQYRRVANLAIFYVKNTNKTICCINTHLDTRPNAAEPNKYPRPQEMELIMQKFKEYGSSCDYWILTGDMNAKDGKEETLNIAYREGFVNTREASSFMTDHINTFNGFGSGTGIIDHILCTSNTNIEVYQTITKEYNNIKYISDHYPIYAYIELK